MSAWWWSGQSLEIPTVIGFPGGQHWRNEPGRLSSASGIVSAVAFGRHSHIHRGGFKFRSLRLDSPLVAPLPHGIRIQGIPEPCPCCGLTIFPSRWLCASVAIWVAAPIGPYVLTAAVGNAIGYQN